MAKTRFASEEIEMEESVSKGVESPHDVSASIINRVASDIRGKLKSLGPPLSPECCVYRVPKDLRVLNEAAYTPQVVSIGPFHHGKKTLKKMEKHKLRYLNKFLDRAATSLEDFVGTVKELESRIRSCYVESFDHLNSDEFIQMILVDAGFIFEFFLRGFYPTLTDENDKILYRRWLKIYIKHDLRMLENQLPFFVLEMLYDLAFPLGRYCYPSFHELTSYYFSYNNQQKKSIQPEVRHFTDLLRYFQLKSSDRKTDDQIELELNDRKTDNQVKEIDHLYSAIELYEAGVTFKASPSKCLFDINFSDGVLTIPCFELYDDTEIYVRNLMALEECHYPNEAYICNYVSIMDQLINTAKDVDLLVRHNIIENHLGDQVQVAALFNTLCTNVRRKKVSRYIRLCRDLNAYYKIRRHKWIAILRHEYLSNPWRITSTIAAIILLVLTLIQTVYAIISS